MLKNRGYSAEYSEDGKNVQIDCKINGTNFSFFYDLDEDELCFSIIFEPKEKIGEVDVSNFEKTLEEEKTPFSDCILDEWGCIHLYGEVLFEEYCECLVNDIVDTIENEHGIVANLKEVSYVWED